MGCTFDGGPDIIFEASGVQCKVRDLSTRASRSRYNMAKINVSKKDAEIIAGDTFNMEPVSVSINGNIQNRYVFPKETLEIGRDSGWLKVYDAEKILNRGGLSNHWHEVTISDFMDYIMSTKDDPYNVITGWKAASSDVVKKEVQSTEEAWTEIVRGSNADIDTDGVSGAVNSAIGYLGMLANMSIDPAGVFRGVELDDETPNQALRKMENVFGVKTWVDESGVLWVGQPEAVPSNRHVVSGTPTDKSYVMKKYTVTKGASPITGVLLSGETHISAERRDTEMFPKAAAYITDPETGDRADGEVYSPDQSREIWELETLEQAARDMLLDAAFSYKNGTIKFNGAASSEKGKLAKMSVGDIIMVGNQISQHCNKQTDSGSWVVSEVQHKMSARQGWEISCEVGSVPPQIETDSFYYKADREYDWTDFVGYSWI